VRSNGRRFIHPTRTRKLPRRWPKPRLASPCGNGGREGGGQYGTWTSRHASRHRLPSLLRLDRWAVRQFRSQQGPCSMSFFFFAGPRREISTFYTTSPLTSGHLARHEHDTRKGVTAAACRTSGGAARLARHTLCCDHPILNSRGGECTPQQGRSGPSDSCPDVTWGSAIYFITAGVARLKVSTSSPLKLTWLTAGRQTDTRCNYLLYGGRLSRRALQCIVITFSRAHVFCWNY
jgi:hypothetical protein